MNSEIKLSNDQITGFSYSFAKALLDRLSSLPKDATVNKKGSTACKTLANSLIHYLEGQIPGINWLQVKVNISVHNWESSEGYVKFVKSSITEGYDFLSTFEKKNSVEINSSHLEQNLKQFLIAKFDSSAVPGGERKRAFNCLMSLGDNITIKELLETPNPLRVKGRHRWNKWGQKSFDWAKKEFMRLGFDVEKYPFFK